MESHSKTSVVAFDIYFNSHLERQVPAARYPRQCAEAALAGVTSVCTAVEYSNEAFQQHLTCGYICSPFKSLHVN